MRINPKWEEQHSRRHSGDEKNPKDIFLKT